MILKIINRKTFPVQVAYINDVSEIDIINNRLEFIQNGNRWIEWEIPINCEVRVFNDGQPVVKDVLIKNPTIDKLNKALKL